MDKKSSKKRGAEGLAYGLALGVMFGIMFDNLALWIPIGLCMGVGFGELKKRKNKDNNPNDTTDKE